MKRKSFSPVFVALLLTLALVLTGCGEKKSTATAKTKREVKKRVEQFYGGLSEADNIMMEAKAGDSVSSVFKKDGNKICVEYPEYEMTYYAFTEDGHNYVISDGETAYEDDFSYMLFSSSIDTSLAMFVTGVFEEPEEGSGEDLAYSATRTDVTSGSNTSSELVYTISGEDEDGETVELTVTGKAENGNVTGFIWNAVSGEESETIEYSFTHGGVSVELPEYTIESEPSLSGEIVHVDSPYATLQDVINELGEDENLSTIMYGDYVYVVTEKDGRHYQLTAPISEEDNELYGDLDFFADDYQDQVNAILGKLEVTDCVDFTDCILTADEASAYTGKTVGELVSEGFSGNGWSIWDGNAELYMEKDCVVYKVLADETEGFDENADFEFEDLYDFVVRGMEFDEVSFTAFPIE